MKSGLNSSVYQRCWLRLTNEPPRFGPPVLDYVTSFIKKRVFNCWFWKLLPADTQVQKSVHSYRKSLPKFKSVTWNVKYIQRLIAQPWRHSKRAPTRESSNWPIASKQQSRRLTNKMTNRSALWACWRTGRTPLASNVKYFTASPVIGRCA